MQYTRFMQVRRVYSYVSPAHVLIKPISESGACTLGPLFEGVRRMYSPFRSKPYRERYARGSCLVRPTAGLKTFGRWFGGAAVALDSRKASVRCPTARLRSADASGLPTGASGYQNRSRRPPKAFDINELGYRHGRTSAPRQHDRSTGRYYTEQLVPQPRARSEGWGDHPWRSPPGRAGGQNRSSPRPLQPPARIIPAQYLGFEIEILGSTIRNKPGNAFASSEKYRGGCLGMRLRFSKCNELQIVARATMSCFE
jgi:hypothetical protein